MPNITTARRASVGQSHSPPVASRWDDLSARAAVPRSNVPVAAAPLVAATPTGQDAFVARLSVGVNEKNAWGVRLVRLGGWLAIEVSLALLAVVLIRDVGLNALNGWTILLGAIGGAVAVRRSSAVSVLVAWFLVFLAMLPALFGGLGLLYVPSLALLLLGRRPRTSALPTTRNCR